MAQENVTRSKFANPVPTVRVTVSFLIGDTVVVAQHWRMHDDKAAHVGKKTCITDRHGSDNHPIGISYSLSGLNPLLRYYGDELIHCRAILCEIR